VTSGTTRSGEAGEAAERSGRQGWGESTRAVRWGGGGALVLDFVYVGAVAAAAIGIILGSRAGRSSSSFT
jgi:hypothetical protein